jgi:hypothetical protein
MWVLRVRGEAPDSRMTKECALGTTSAQPSFACLFQIQYYLEKRIHSELARQASLVVLSEVPLCGLFSRINLAAAAESVIVVR